MKQFEDLREKRSTQKKTDKRCLKIDVIVDEDPFAKGIELRNASD